MLFELPGHMLTKDNTYCCCNLGQADWQGVSAVLVHYTPLSYLQLGHLLGVCLGYCDRVALLLLQLQGHEASVVSAYSIYISWLTDEVTLACPN